MMWFSVGVAGFYASLNVGRLDEDDDSDEENSSGEPDEILADVELADENSTTRLGFQGPIPTAHSQRMTTSE